MSIANEINRLNDNIKSNVVHLIEKYEIFIDDMEKQLDPKNENDIITVVNMRSKQNVFKSVINDLESLLLTMK